MTVGSPLIILHLPTVNQNYGTDSTNLRFLSSRPQRDLEIRTDQYAKRVLDGLSPIRK